MDARAICASAQPPTLSLQIAHEWIGLNALASTAESSPSRRVIDRRIGVSNSEQDDP